MIPRDFIQDLLRRVDIVDIIGAYVELKKKGNEYAACCPFHQEKTPSFTVVPDKQFFYCFGCGQKGSSVGFLMQHLGLSFPEAIHELARKAGVPVPEASSFSRGGDRKNQSREIRLIELMTEVMHYYEDSLEKSTQATSYLQKRGITQEVAKQYHLGFSPNQWQNLLSLSHYQEGDALACGLVNRSNQGRCYDRFRGRLMFPILNLKKEPVGFGGRLIEESSVSEAPKYLNSPETILFSKKNEIYGLNQARQSAYREGFLLVVEGYMDVVSLAQHGIQNVVASLGTATTESFASNLLKVSDRIVYCFDRDEAGDKAASRSVDVNASFLSDNKRVEILQLPGKLDPDEFIKVHGREKFLSEVANAISLTQFLIRDFQHRFSQGAHDIEGQARLLQELRPVIQRIPGPAVKTIIVNELADYIKLDKEQISHHLGVQVLRKSAKFASGPVTRQYSSRQQPQGLEHRLLVILLAHPEWSDKVSLDLIDTKMPEGRALQALIDGWSVGELPENDIGGLFEYFRQTPCFSSLKKALDDPIREDASEALLDSILNSLFVKKLTEQIVHLTVKAGKSILTESEKDQLKILLRQKEEFKLDSIKN